MDFKKLDFMKSKLDALRPLNQDILANLEQWFEVELTYSSNAIEGNTLTRHETALVLEKGFTVSGKPLKDYLEAVNHRDALILMKHMVHKKGFLKEDIFSIHKMILKGIDDSHAGVIRSVPVRISGSPVILPNYLKLPTLLDTFIQDFTATTDHPVKQAALAHYNIVTIHPFIDGNGRTARIIMNLILMQHGYPPAIIRPQDRLRYIKSLEKAQLGGSMEDYFSVIETAVLRSLGIYIKAFTQKPLVDLSPHLLKIGDLAKQTQESVASLRYWTKIGLLEVSTTTPSGYQLYDRHQIERCAKIRELQKQRYTLDEIGGLMGGLMGG